MVAEDFLQDPQVRQWLDGVEPAWMLLTFESLRALRHKPSAIQTAIRVANDLSVGEIAGSPVARNTLILQRQAIERGGLPLTATGNLSRAVVSEMCKLIEWPDYDQADAFRFNKVINEPDFLPLDVVRQLAQPATLVRAQRGKLVATPLGKSMLSEARQWSLSICANDWQSAEKLTRLCTIPEPAMFSGTWDRTPYATEARILRPLLWFGLLECRSEKMPDSRFGEHYFYRKAKLFDRLLAFDVRVDFLEGARH